MGVLMNYRRRISREEAGRGSVLVAKNMLKNFPPVGESFKLRCGGEEGDVEIVSVPCQCVGPDKPHEHYYLDVSGLVKLRLGKIVSISKNDKGDFSLSTR